MIETLSAVRAATEDLRAVLDGAGPVAAAQPVPVRAAEMVQALAERDRKAASVQREADERLAALEHVSREASNRLAALHETTAEVARLQRHVEELSAQLDAMRTENQELRAAAKERLDLVVKNERAHARFKAVLKARLADISDSLS